MYTKGGETKGVEEEAAVTELDAVDVSGILGQVCV